MIDVTQPLELSDGTRVELRKAQSGWIDVVWDEGTRTFTNEGQMYIRDETSHHPKLNGRTLRNVRQPAKATATGLEHLERLEALARRIAAVDTGNKEFAGKTWVQTNEIHAIASEAREIVALLPERTTDPDWILAGDLAVAQDCDRKEWGDRFDLGWLHCSIYDALKRGRELALAERGE